MHTMEVVTFAGLAIAWDRRVLEPRPWTAEQGRWIADLAPSAPEGRILELCCGAGQIGLVAAHRTGRDLVQVDRDPVAADYARRNAAAAGITSEVRERPLSEALEDHEVFPLVIVDPPWLASHRLAEFPDDPVGAVDGGHDGMAVVEPAVDVGLAHLHSDGHLVLQVGSTAQASAVAERVRAAGFVVAGMRVHRPGGVLLHVCREGR